MFGNVDIDFTFYRSVALDHTVTLERFIADRVRSYISFLTLLRDEDYGKSLLEEICVLGAHLSPVLDENFVEVTGPQTKLDADAFIELGTRIELSQPARTSRTIALNNALEQELARLGGMISFVRIDKSMLNSKTVIDEKYGGRFRLDHHPNRTQTLKLWYSALAEKIPAFAERSKTE